MATKKFSVHIPQEEVDDLNRRLGSTRWPDEQPGGGWKRGAPVSYLKGLDAYWRDSFDWRAKEASINRRPQYTTKIDGIELHYLHVQGTCPQTLAFALADPPADVAVFSGDVAIRRFAERTDAIVRWSEFDRGGHFAAMEAPDLLVNDIRGFFGEIEG